MIITGLIYSLGIVGVLVLTPLGLLKWARWVSRRHRRAGWRRLVWLPLIALGLSLAGMIISGVICARGLGSLTDEARSMRATLLAAAISEAMNCGGLLVFPAWLLSFVSLCASTVGSISRPKAPRCL